MDDHTQKMYPEEDFYPPEFLRFSDDESSVVYRGARLFDVPAKSFLNWRWQMKAQVDTVSGAEKALASLSSSERQGFQKVTKTFGAGITPYYMSLMDPNNEFCPIRLQVMPRAEELSDPLGLPDPLREAGHSPVKEVVHVYPDRVAFCVAQLCPVYCRYCFRKRRDDEVGLHFNRNIVERGLNYISANPNIRDVLITGGDPFIAQTATIEDLLQRLRSIPHVEIIRFGTRTPVTLPFRITRAFTSMLSQYHPIFVNTHFNCPEELTPEAAQAISNLVEAGIPVGNQSVLLKGVNDDPERFLELCRGLLRMRVRPYYLFHPHLVAGTAHLRTSYPTGLQVMKFLRGKITGMGIPTYVVDTPSGKVPVGVSHILGIDQQDLIIEDLHGRIWRERGAAL